MNAVRSLTANIPSFFTPLLDSGTGIVYGPYAAENNSTTVGINPLGTGEKACSFNCVYCDLGKTEVRLNKVKNGITLPLLSDIEREITDAFKKIHASGPVIDSITISGNGEPTLHPEFAEIAKMLVTARDLWLPGKPIKLYTNGVGLDTRKIVDGANLLDQRLVKLDAGGDRLFKLVNAPLSRTNLPRVLNGIRNLKDVSTQSLFFEGSISNTQPADIDEWLEVIAMIRPQVVFIHGLRRVSATPGLVRCEEDTLYAIASRLERKTQIKATVFP
jgi:wyosine [tRNA(Phe)-imidazoG37] synthetase (radical SAM superfamily)